MSGPDAAFVLDVQQKLRRALLRIDELEREILTTKPASDITTFVIDGPPVPKARPRFVTRPGGKHYALTSETTKNFEEKVRRVALQAGIRELPAGTRIGLRTDFLTQDDRQRDLDNLVKAVTDGLNKIAWHDDCQIHHLVATKATDRESPKSTVGIWRLS